ncbi:hypothetical protein BS50DRAFT_628616 [Corynespora cassiicola Philippines]|uniref:Anaphase-promoting complex subunit 4 n=1 Tax=Corynespora cassiicola Philippines TaxID=1448308 RepID=A0A2T2PD08_CORCC|nr:hypothetical protein BS50DRAFT_628616 [Corynespora cassiicola Philippines]
MDLIAVVTDEENLDVYRINGQKAFGLERKSEDDTVDEICWEFNGRAIAVAWSDGYADIVSAETGKVIHKDLSPPQLKDLGTTRITRIGWGLNFIDTEVVKRRTGVNKKTFKKEAKGKATIDLLGPTSEDWDPSTDEVSLEDFLARQPDFQTLDVAPELPDQLALMDTESLLPKLPPIPLPPALPFMRIQQADSGNFSSQAQVDSLLHSSHMKDHNSVDMLIRCTDKGSVHPSIYDSLETVDIRLPESWKVESTPVYHASHPYSCSHTMLAEITTSAKEKNLALIPLTLGFIPSAGNYLHLIASKTSQLQNLLIYIQQCLQRIRTFWKHSQDLPSKFMRNIEETLAEKGEGDLMTNLFHLACTGHCPPMIREWLVDELAEQGHKRWDTTVSSSLNTLLSLFHENLIPALDRCSIVISRLRGLAEYHEQDWIFRGPLSDFTSLLELIKNLRLLAHTCLLYASDEKRQFHTFSKWLRFCIDFEATEPGSQSRMEMEGRDPGVDIALLLEYIKNGLTKSDLTAFLRAEAELNATDAETPSYEETHKAIQLLKEGAGWREESLSLEFVLRHFGTGVKNLLSQVSNWQATNTSMDCGISLHSLEEAGTDLRAKLDMRMVHEALTSHPDAITTYIALAPPSSPQHIHIHRLLHNPTITTLPHDALEYSTATLTFPPGSHILDVKFADDFTLLTLLRLPDPPKTYLIIALQYTPTRTPSTNNPHPISYTPYPRSALEASLLPNGVPAPHDPAASVSISHQAITESARHVFDAKFTPLRLVINGRKDRRVVLVLGDDRKHYRVLDLDYLEETGGEGEGDVEMEGGGGG